MVHPLAHYISYEKFSSNHKAFLSTITSRDEPKTFCQASQDENWEEAMQKEIKALEQNQTWSLEDLPEGKKPIDSKWVYKIKYKPNGEIERYKARLVAKGFTQMEGIDYHETFAPVAKLVTMRILLTIAVKRDWHIHQLDVNNAFLHGDLHEEVYMKIPQGFSKGRENKVCRLRKSIYGLKQASRNWYHKFTETLLELGFTQSRANYSFFIYKHNGVFVTALIYVDDVIVMGDDLKTIQFVKAQLHERFSIKDLGTLNGHIGCKPSAFPMEQNLKLDAGLDEEKVDANTYRRPVGKMLYLQATRPDVTYAVNVLSQFVADPRANHMQAAVRVLRYLKLTLGQGILLSKNGAMDLVAYSDADWLGCQVTRRSRTTPPWRSSYILEVKETIYRVPIFCRSRISGIGSYTKHIANNPVFHERTKHVEMDCYFVRERVESKEVKPVYVHTRHQIADLFTKPLGAQPYRTYLSSWACKTYTLQLEGECWILLPEFIYS
ncbi:hypothetical protein E3N88_17147 [Mikania micrantha]|uniref:Reverse transcriptase Ty1/copia-type domain-containing protein n=1 Tax=Mikania micrantha TaxID=192012 RepID=A0A5N6NR52_9ASTR|nr:hypothetical protein E3N88_17147 [Mikania micrantha]